MARVTEAKQDEAEHRLVDTLVPREVAERALALYSDYLIRTNDRVFAMQRAVILASEELGLHRHWRGTR
jgi:hypothetical protein